MKKNILLRILLVVCLLLCVTSAIAESFDTSVFPADSYSINKDEFIDEYSIYHNFGSCYFEHDYTADSKSQIVPLATYSEGIPRFYIYFDFRSDEWIFADTVMVKIGENVYTFENASIDRQTINGEIQEVLYISSETADEQKMLNDWISYSGDIRIRISGNKRCDFTVPRVGQQIISEFYELFLTACGKTNEDTEAISTIAVKPYIAAGRRHSLGLKANGTVISTQNIDYWGKRNVSSYVSNWRNIVKIAAGGDFSVGLTTDGTVVAIGDNEFGECNTSNWNNIVDIAAGNCFVLGLKSDGSVLAIGDNKYNQCETKNWNNIVSVSAGDFHAVGVKSDGTVVATGSNSDGQCNVGNWSNIVSTASGRYHTVALKADGTVVATGSNESGQCNVGNWSNIVAIAAGELHTVGLVADGTVVSTGWNGDGECNTQGWSDIVTISAKYRQTIALKSDGTVVSTGNNEYNQCDTADWNLLE